MHHDPTQWDQVCAMEFALARFAGTLPALPSSQAQDSSVSRLPNSNPPVSSSNSNSGSPTPELGLGMGMGMVQGASQVHGGGLGLGGAFVGVQGVDVAGWGAYDPLMLASMADLDMDMGLGGMSASSTALQVNPTTNLTHTVTSNSNVSISSPNPNLENTTTSSPDPTDPDPDPELILIHTLLHVATIQLFHPFAQKDARAHAKCLEAARKVTGVLRRWVLFVPGGSSSVSVSAHHAGSGSPNSVGSANELGNTGNASRGDEEERERERDEKSTALVGALDPIMGTCCMCAADVFVREKMLVGSGMSGMGSGMSSSGMASGMVQSQMPGMGMASRIGMDMGSSGMGAGEVKPDEEIDTLLCVLRKLGRTFPVAGECPRIPQFHFDFVC